jgi:hypothetical protein
MNSRIFAAFGLGALVASISLGAIQWASAAGNATITVCASKSTGAMRYITKGSCKKTESVLTWNQQGPQGETGPRGDKGEPGAPGSSADTSVMAKKLDVVPRVISTQQIPSTALPANGRVLIPGQSDYVTSAVELLAMSTRSYTRRYDIPRNWIGTISGSCPSDAPVPLAYGVYALDSSGVKIGENGWPPYGGYTAGSRADISFGTMGTPSPGFTLYVTQACAPITQAASQ